MRSISTCLGLGLVSVISLGLGRVAGDLYEGAAPVERAGEPDPPRRDVPKPVVASPPVPEAPVEGDLAACEARLAACEEIARVEREQLVGVETPWSDEVPAGFWPADVDAALDAVAEECPDVRVDEVFVDCDEYPCLVWFPEHRPLMGGIVGDLPIERCDAWPLPLEDSLGGAPSADMTHRVEWTVAIFAPDADLDEDMRKRIGHRRDFAVEIVRDRWDLRDPHATREEP